MIPKVCIVLFVLLGLGSGVYTVSALRAPTAAAIHARLYSNSLHSTMSNVRSITVAELEHALSRGAILLDVRTRDEYVRGHIDGARHIDYTAHDFDEAVLRTLDPTLVHVVYCRSGRRSALAADRMRELGFVNVVDLTGGIQSWEAAGNMPHVELK